MYLILSTGIVNFFSRCMYLFYSSCYKYRIPEVILESNDVWNDLDHEDLVEIRRLMLHFLVSTAIQRFTHAMFEVPLNDCIHTCQMYVKWSNP